jgi:hypothetical protein
MTKENRWLLSLEVHGVELARWEGMAESREDAEKALLAKCDAQADRSEFTNFTISGRVIP